MSRLIKYTSKPTTYVAFFIILALYLLDLSFIIPTAPLYSQTTSQDVSLYLDPIQTTTTTNSELSVPLKLDTNGTVIRAIQADIIYPADLVEITKIEVENSAYPLEVLNKSGEGKISILRGSFSPIAGNKLFIANLKMKGLKPGVATLRFQESSAAVNSPTDSLTHSPDFNLTIINPATPSPRPTITPSVLPTSTPTPTPTAFPSPVVFITPIPTPTVIPTPTPSPSPLVTPKPTSLPELASPSLIPTPAPQASVNPSPTPNKPSYLTIYAAGTPAQGGYPLLQIQIKNPLTNQWEAIKTSKEIKGDPFKRLFIQLHWTYPTRLTPSQVRIAFINDLYIRKTGEDRNLVIDKIVLDGVSYESERPATFSVGNWNQSTGCSVGLKKSEWLHCNGYFEYR